MRIQSIRLATLLLAAAGIPACGGGGSGNSSPSASSPVSTPSRPSVSRDGRFVVFETTSPAQVVLVDRADSANKVVLVAGAGEVLSNAVLTPDGRFVAFEVRPVAGGNAQILRRDLTTGISTLVSADVHGQPGDGNSTNPTISNDGSTVAFQSTAVSLGARSPSSHTVLIRDVPDATTQTAGTPVPGDDVDPSLSGDGNFVAFQSRPLEGGFSSVLRFNRENGQLLSVSESTAGTPPNGDSAAPSISEDGRVVAFESRSTTLAPLGVSASAFTGQTNVFVRDALTGALVLASGSMTPGVPTNGDSSRPSLSQDGQRVAFESTAANLTPDQIPSGESNVFVHDVTAGTTNLVPPLATTTPVPTSPVATSPPETSPVTTSPTATSPVTTLAPRPPRVPSATPTVTPVVTSTPTSTASPTVAVAPTEPTTAPATPGVPTGNAAGVGTGTPVAPTGSAAGLGSGTPVAPTGNAAGLGTGTPVVPTGNASGLGTGTPVVPTGNASGLGTGTPVVPTGNASGLGTGTTVGPTGNAGGLGTGTPVVPTGNGAPLGTGTPVVSTGTGTPGTTPVISTGITITVAAIAIGNARPRISADGGWVVFESSQAGILVANLATGEVSALR